MPGVVANSHDLLPLSQVVIKHEQDRGLWQEESRRPSWVKSVWEAGHELMFSPHLKDQASARPHPSSKTPQPAIHCQDCWVSSYPLPRVPEMFSCHPPSLLFLSSSLFNPLDLTVTKGGHKLQKKAKGSLNLLFFLAMPMAHRSSWTRDRSCTTALTQHQIFDPLGYKGIPYT